MTFNVLKNNFLFLFVLGGCATAPFVDNYRSPLDLKYTLKKKFSPSPYVNFYQKILSQSLTSGCTYYPTDSAYAKRCGLIKTTARFLNEPDASKIYLFKTIEKSKLYFVDLPECL